MSVVTIHQPEHAPWMGFFHKIAQADVLVLLDTVQFRKNYFGNRNRILTPQGPVWITVPVHGGGSPAYRDVEIVQDGRWQKRYWKSVYYNYRNHPHFAEYGPWLDELLNQEWTHLGALNERLIRDMSNFLGLETSIVRASDLAARGSSSLLLLELCRETGATTYLSGRMGKSYLDETIFDAVGIQVRYQDFHHPEYPQRNAATFVPQMSTLDLLMNCGAEGREVIEGATSSVSRASPPTEGP